MTTFPTLAPKAIIASFSNEDRTRAFQLQANGALVEITRATPSDVWSPPEEVAHMRNSIDPFEKLLADLTS